MPVSMTSIEECKSEIKILLKKAAGDITGGFFMNNYQEEEI